MHFLYKRVHTNTTKSKVVELHQLIVFKEDDDLLQTSLIALLIAAQFCNGKLMIKSLAIFLRGNACCMTFCIVSE